jgi:hypothetical protein
MLLRLDRFLRASVGHELHAAFLVDYTKDAKIGFKTKYARVEIVDIAPSYRERSRGGDFAAMAATILLALLEGVEPGLLAGVGLSIFLHLSQPGASPSVPRMERSKAIIC